MKRFLLLSAVAWVGLLTSCTSSVRLINFPFDPGGRSLNSPAGESSPQLGGRYIVFSSDRNGNQGIYLFDTVNRYLVDLPGLNALDMIASDPAVSENGRYIVFTGSRRGRVEIYLYDRELRQLRNLTENLLAEVRNPTISADGGTIAFEVSEAGQWNIVVYDRSGQQLSLPTTP